MALRLYLLLLVISVVCVNSLPSVIDDDSVDIISLNESEYCFVNQTTIRVSDNFTSELQDIVNKTEHVIISTTINSTVIFIAPSNGSRCSSDDDDDVPTTIFIIQMIIYSVTLLVAGVNITPYLLIKELRTVPGLLIILMCSIVTVVTVVAAVNIIYDYTIDNESTVVCIAFVNVIFYLLFVYQSTKLVILFHFAYLMYKSYKLMPQGTANKLAVMIKYTILVLVTSTLSFLIAIIVDLAVDGAVYNERRSFCINTEIAIEDTPVFSLAATAELAMFIVLEFIVFFIGLTLYFLVTKSCCGVISTNLRVAITLAATIGINIIILVVLNGVSIPSNLYILSITCGTALEQVILLVLFLSSRNVRTRFSCMVKKAGTTLATELT